MDVTIISQCHMGTIIIWNKKFSFFTCVHFILIYSDRYYILLRIHKGENVLGSIYGVGWNCFHHNVRHSANEYKKLILFDIPVV
jgi:hypothetical protein